MLVPPAAAIVRSSNYTGVTAARHPGRRRRRRGSGRSARGGPGWESPPGECDALTTSVDLFATLADIFGVSPAHRTHGTSLRPLLDGASTWVREWSLLGIWGRQVHLIDSEGRKYARAPEGDNAPISMWSNRWSTMPLHAAREFPALPMPDDRAFLDRMPGSTIPVIRQPFQPGDLLPFWAGGRFDGNHLWDIDEDPTEDHDLAGTALEKEMADGLREALRSIEAPADQLARLGLS